MALPLTNPNALIGDAIIDSITSGYSWELGSSRTINFSVSNGFDGEHWEYPQKIALQLAAALGVFSYYVDVRFNFVGVFATPTQAAQNGSHINLSIGSNGTIFTNSHQWAIGLPPDNFFNRFYEGAPGDLFFNIDSPAVNLPSYEPGSQGWFLLLHELGHVLGLKHPHDDGGYARPTFSSSGIGAYDMDWASIMSYNDDAFWNQFQWDPATPMVLDVIGLMALYGKNTTTNRDDTTFSLFERGAYYTVWDSFGIDTIDASLAEEGWAITLPDAIISLGVIERIGFALPISQAEQAFPSTLKWLIGDYENAIGSPFTDSIIGNVFDNSIHGGAADDRIEGGGGNDAINGGTGIDTAVYSGTAASYTLSLSLNSTTTITDRTANRDGTDTLTNVERLQFTDTMLALDTASNQNAGNAYLLYQAAFDRTPDVGGLGYWISKLDGGVDVVRDVAMNFILSDEFTRLYGPNPSGTEFVNLLYKNVLDRAPDAGGLGYWLDEFEREGDTLIKRASTLNNFAISAENISNVTDQIIGGIGYQAYLG